MVGGRLIDTLDINQLTFSHSVGSLMIDDAKSYAGRWAGRRANAGSVLLTGPGHLRGLSGGSSDALAGPIVTLPIDHPSLADGLGAKSSEQPQWLEKSNTLTWRRASLLVLLLMSFHLCR